MNTSSMFVEIAIGLTGKDFQRFPLLLDNESNDSNNGV
jgi:hypothetical protein